MKNQADKSQRLLLPIVAKEPEKQKLTVNLTADVHTELLEYQRAYRDMNQTEIPLDLIVEHVLAQHMKRDKAFQTWKATHPKTAE
ncbi:hypothetical protein WI91_02495 [Burkholderia vietnamiensis]|uniref:DUF2274 domain-containing protein n=1 Tax=Burkholderia vietnamiensis TaxID=60552 RepID=UPI00075E47F9|nr:DUF2274 domain-containing protein [Burkholderia vietnamiensis]KVD99681.1 hypothetical protein WI91_02495 [Burkholderia vietnamiensis]